MQSPNPFHLLCALILLFAPILLPAALALCTDALPVINVPVTTKYITTEVQTVDQDETIVLVGHLCAQSKGMAVNVTVLLNNNPSWDPTFGVLRYYIVDDPNKVWMTPVLQALRVV